MNTLNKIIKKIFTRDLEDLGPTSPCATDQLRHQLFKDGGMAPPPRPVRVNPLSLNDLPINYGVVTSLLYGSHRYRVVVDIYGRVYLQHRQVGPNGQWQTIRSFYDDDKEYTLNCALEAFEYLTKEI